MAAQNNAIVESNGLSIVGSNCVQHNTNSHGATRARSRRYDTLGYPGRAAPICRKRDAHA